jgi:hypothetical protein
VHVPFRENSAWCGAGEQLDKVANADRGDQKQNDSFDRPHTNCLKRKGSNVKSCDDDRPQERDMKH